MKELSIEEKAKAYDEAIEKFDVILNLNTVKESGTIFVDDVRKIFPELKESEDEKIRKDIISFVEQAIDAGYGIISKERREKWITWLKKQGEQKPADKVESKFKVKKGEWYICTNTFVSKGKIIAIKGQTYQSKQEDDTITCEDDCLFIDRHDGKASDYFRLWTIQDAKDGDVLACENGWTCIFKCLNDNLFSSHCFVDNTGWFCENSGQGHTLDNRICGEIHPATKEQREQLKKAMADAGYTFDFEKKELKKIENEIEIPFGAKDSELQEATYYIPKGFHAEISNDNVVIKKGEKPTAWKPSKEQMKGIKCAIKTLKYQLNVGDKRLNSLYNDLKKLRKE